MFYIIVQPVEYTMWNVHYDYISFTVSLRDVTLLDLTNTLCIHSESYLSENILDYCFIFYLLFQFLQWTSTCLQLCGQLQCKSIHHVVYDWLSRWGVGGWGGGGHADTLWRCQSQFICISLLLSHRPPPPIHKCIISWPVIIATIIITVVLFLQIQYCTVYFTDSFNSTPLQHGTFYEIYFCKKLTMLAKINFIVYRLHALSRPQSGLHWSFKMKTMKTSNVGLCIFRRLFISF